MGRSLRFFMFPPATPNYRRNAWRFLELGEQRSARTTERGVSIRTGVARGHASTRTKDTERKCERSLRLSPREGKHRSPLKAFVPPVSRPLKSVSHCLRVLGCPFAQRFQVRPGRRQRSR